MFPSCGDAELAEVAEVILGALGRIVGQKSMTDSELVQQMQERKSIGKQSAAAINRAVHVQRDMADLTQARVQNLWDSKSQSGIGQPANPPKSQTPNAKSQTNPNLQASKEDRGHLAIEETEAMRV